MAIISKQFTYKIPNEFLVDHSFTQGKTAECTYHGPDKIFLQVSQADHKEKYGPLTEDDRADGRPIPADCYLFEVSVNDYPLIMQLRAPVVGEKQQMHDGEVIAHPLSPAIEGYSRLTYQLPILPGDVFNKDSLQIVDNKPTIQPFTVTEKILGSSRTEEYTWDEVRQQRDTMLDSSDSSMAEDMPEGLKAQFKIYRQRLRDLPAVMQAHNVPPTIAKFMFPDHPHNSRPVKGGQ
jgi:hypothetical protein